MPWCAPRGEARDDWRIIDDLARQLGFAAVTGWPTKWIGTSRAARGRAACLGADGARGRHRPRSSTCCCAGSRRRQVRAAPGRAQPGEAARTTARHRAWPTPSRPGSPANGCKHQRRRGCTSTTRAIERRTGPVARRPPTGRRVPAADDRPARGPLAQLVDAQHAPLRDDGARQHRALVNPADAADARCRRRRRRSESCLARGEIEIAIEHHRRRGARHIAVPHGWGHRDGGWQTANAAGGANVNVLTSAVPADMEALSGMAHLNAVPVRLEKVPARRKPRRVAAVG